MQLKPQRWFSGHTDFVHSPTSLDVRLDLGFGITCLFRVDIDCRFPSQELLSNAKHCMVVLCGGKQVFVYLDASATGGRSVGRVLIEAKDPPKECTIEVQGSIMLDVGRYMDWLMESGYPIAIVKAHINGKSPQRKRISNAG